MDKIISFLIFSFSMLACIVLYSITLSITDYLITSKIVVLRFEWALYLYKFGVGILLYYPCNYILNHKKSK